MTGLVRRTGGSVRAIRTPIEVTVLIAGAALGGTVGTVGTGTVVHALSIGPWCTRSCRASRCLRRSRRA